MHTESKTAFRPSLERCEPRVVAAAGVTAAVSHHVAHVVSHPAQTVSAEAHHAPKVQSHHAAHSKNHQVSGTSRNHSSSNNSQSTSPASGNGSSQYTTPISSPTLQANLSTGNSALAPSPNNSTTNQAWVELVNMTGQDLEYQIKLGPYANGQFLPFDISGQGDNSVQYRMSSLISHGQRVQADFAIQFGNGPITPLQTGISQQSAQGYYIFMDTTGQYYVTPFFQSSFLSYSQG